MAQKGMDDYTRNLSAGVEQSLEVNGDFFHVQSATGEVQLKFDDGRWITRTVGQGGRVYYSRVTVKSVTSQPVVLQLGYGYATDARSTVNAVISAPIQPANLNSQLPEVTVPAGGSVKVADANADRKELRLSIKSSEPGGVYLGDATIANNEGGWLEPGMIDYVATEAELWAYNPGGSAVVVSSLDLERV